MQLPVLIAILTMFLPVQVSANYAHASGSQGVLAVASEGALDGEYNGV